MSLSTPTTKEISDNIIAQLESTLNQTIPLLPKSFMRVLAKALGAVFVILYKYAGFIFLQMFVQEASNSETIINGKTLIPLVEWGRLIGVGDPAPATSAELEIQITVNVQSGTLPSSTQLVSTDNGVTYLTLESIILDAPLKTVNVMAVSDQAGGGGVGTIGNLDIGSILSFVNPLANISSNTLVTNQIVTGAEAESTEAYRQRVKDRFQKRPQGGALSDYVLWGTEPVGIINIYPYTSDNPGQVDVYAEATPESSSDPDGIPTGAQLQAVADSINLNQNGLATRRPANALANTLPITRRDFEVTIFGLSVTETAEVQEDITTAIEEYFAEREPFIDGLSIPPRRDRITQTSISSVVEDVVAAAGGVFNGTELFDVLTSSTIGIYSLGIGEKAKVSSVSFV